MAKNGETMRFPDGYYQWGQRKIQYLGCFNHYAISNPEELSIWLYISAFEDNLVRLGVPADEIKKHVDDMKRRLGVVDRPKIQE